MSQMKKALNIHHFRVVNRFAHLKEVKISDIERFLASYVSMPTARKIIHQLNEIIPVTHILYDPNPFRVLQRIAGFKASVCMRLHASILSFMAKTPSLSINYHNKCKNWCEQIGMSEEYQFDALEVCSDSVVNTLTQSLGTEFAKPLMTKESAIQASLLNWR